jgi:hypothetical protein
MDQAINDNPCVCCGEYAVEGSQLCWRCQQEATKENFIENYLKDKKVLDKKNKA